MKKPLLLVGVFYLLWINPIDMGGFIESYVKVTYPDKKPSRLRKFIKKFLKGFIYIF